jgi:hypothetical protein
LEDGLLFSTIGVVSLFVVEKFLEGREALLFLIELLSLLESEYLEVPGH